MSSKDICDIWDPVSRGASRPLFPEELSLNKRRNALGLFPSFCLLVGCLNFFMQLIVSKFYFKGFEIWLNIEKQ